LLNGKQVKINGVCNHHDLGCLGSAINYRALERQLEILKAMGIPIIESLEESDSQCALLTKNDIAYGVGTEDMDILTFGSKKLLRNISSSKKNEIIEYDLQKILDELNYTHDEFIDLCILLGCDYVAHLEGIGIRKAKEIIDEHRSIYNYLNSPQYDCYLIPNGYAEKCNLAKEYFKNPIGNQYTNTQLKLTIPDQKKIKDLLINKYSYSKTKTEKIIAKIIAT
jgi:flap endonuclease-1